MSIATDVEAPSRAKRLKAVLLNELDALEGIPVDQLLQRRYERLRGYGAYDTAS